MKSSYGRTVLNSFKMQSTLVKRLLRPTTLHGRTVCTLHVESDSKGTLNDSLESLLIKEPPLLSMVMEWSKYYYNQSSEMCQKYYDDNVVISLDKAVNICNNSIRQSSLEWYTERQKRITGSTCFFFYKYCKHMHPNWKRKLEFACKAKDFPLFLTQATTHGLSHEKAAQRKYRENIRGSTLLNMGLVVHPKVPFLGFSPDGVVFDKDKNPQKLIEIKCPLDGKFFSSEDLFRLAPFMDPNGSIRKNYKYYGQVQLGMFILGLPYCDFIMYSSSETDYTSKRIDFDEQFVQEMVSSLVKIYFKEMLPWLTKKNLGVQR